MSSGGVMPSGDQMVSPGESPIEKQDASLQPLLMHPVEPIRRHRKPSKRLPGQTRALPRGRHIMGRSALLIGAALFITGFDAQAQSRTETCAPTGMSRSELGTLQSGQWAVADHARRNALARALVDCVGNPDPEIRDGFVFGGLQHWMRSGQVSDETLAFLQDRLEANMAAADPRGFRSSFSALLLAEIVRTDRMRPWMTAERRERVLDAAVNYLTNLRDHRGFDPRHGYRHAPAHAGDIMMQLALNTAYGGPALMRVLGAIASQIAPANVFYIHGESERLARPVLMIARRNLFTEAEWSAWFASIAGPGPLGQWDDWFRSTAGLARRHDLTMFLLILHANIGAERSPQAFAPMRTGVEAAIRAIP